jgi:hypothetical protein
MDTFCGGLCACAVSLPGKVRVASSDGEIVLSAHRYEQRQRQSGRRRISSGGEGEDDDDVSYDDEDDNDRPS